MREGHRRTPSVLFIYNVIAGSRYVPAAGGRLLEAWNMVNGVGQRSGKHWGKRTYVDDADLRLAVVPEGSGRKLADR